MPDPRPNILFIISDQHNARCVGYENHPDVKTPNLDTLARNGVQFRRAYTTKAECMPSRITFLTGLYPHTHGIYANTNDRISDLPSLAALLRDKAGYRTGAVGKWHMGDWRTSGFEDIVPQVSPWGNRYVEDLEARGVPIEEPDIVECYTGQTDMCYEDTEPRWVGRETNKMIDRLGDEPWFIYCSYEPPHDPYKVPKDNPFPYDPNEIELPPYDIDHFRTKPFSWRRGVENLWHAGAAGEPKVREALANYYSLISMVDDNIGRTIRHLEERGLLDNTIVIYTSDHGDFAGEHGQIGKNAPGAYESLYRIPMLFYWKGRFGREVSYNMVDNVDFFPTICGLLGLDVPMHAQGESFHSVLMASDTNCGYPSPRKEKVFFDEPFLKTVRTPTRKLTFSFAGEKKGEMYDLELDPGETRNVYDDPHYREDRSKLTEDILAWLISTEQPEVWEELRFPMPPFRWYRMNPRFRHAGNDLLSRLRE